MTVDWERTFHLGVRVPDLDAAMTEQGEALGLTWAAVQERDQAIWTPATGTVTVPLRFTYSCEGPMHVELLEGAPGSFWDGRQHPGAHHAGVWCDDVAAETERLAGLGWTLVGAARPPGEGYGFFTYLAPPSGLVVELVAGVARPMFERWWAGAPSLG